MAVNLAHIIPRMTPNLSVAVLVTKEHTFLKCCMLTNGPDVQLCLAVVGLSQ